MIAELKKNRWIERRASKILPRVELKSEFGKLAQEILFY